MYKNRNVENTTKSIPERGAYLEITIREIQRVVDAISSLEKLVHDGEMEDKELANTFEAVSY